MAEEIDLTDNLYFLASAFSRKLSAEADDIFATFGLSSSHALILMIVSEEPGIQPNQLAEKLYLKPSTITRLVQKLERREMVNRSSEGRASYIKCTEKGEELADDINDQWEELLATKKEQLGERYTEVLSEMITKALDTLEEQK